MVSVAVVRKPAWFVVIPFASAANEFRQDSNESPTLILVRLHRHSKLFLDVYFDQYNRHFTVMHDSGKSFNVGHPQRFVGALLHNAYLDGDKPSPKAKLPLGFLDQSSKFPIDSCTWGYQDWTTGHEDQPNPVEHFVWLSNEFTPYMTKPGAPFVPPNFTLGLPPVEDWPKQTGEVPWVLDPAEHSRPGAQSYHESAGPSSGDDKRWKRKKKKHQRPKKQELKVTTRGQGDDAPVWTNTGSNLSSSSDSQTEGDSGVRSYWRLQDDARSTTRHDHTPRYSLDTIRKIDEGTQEDAPLSNHSGGSNGDQEMMSGDDRDNRDEEVTGTNPGPAATNTAMGPEVALIVASEVADPWETPLLGDPADTDDEKARWDAFQLLMHGFYTATHTLLDSYQDACREVQTIVWRALQKAMAVDHTFMWGASAAIRHWVKEVQPAMDCMDKSLEEQAWLLQKAREAGKEATKDILALLPVETNPYLSPVVPREDILSPALEKAIEAVNAKLSMLVHRHVLPQQARVFHATLFQVMCSYQQEMDGMATSQVVLPGQIVLNLWGISRNVLEG